MEKITMTGTVEFVGETQTFGSGFTKRNLIINNGDKWAPYFEVSAKKDICGMLDSVKAGDEVEITFFVDGGRMLMDDKRIEGGKRAYTELSLASIMVKHAAAPTAEALPTTATDWPSLVKLAAAYGFDEEAVKQRCKNYGKPFKTMEPKDWQVMAANFVNAKKAEAVLTETDPDDLPF